MFLWPGDDGAPCCTTYLIAVAYDYYVSQQGANGGTTKAFAILLAMYTASPFTTGRSARQEILPFIQQVS